MKPLNNTCVRQIFKVLNPGQQQPIECSYFFCNFTFNLLGFYLSLLLLSITESAHFQKICEFAVCTTGHILCF